MAKRYDPILCMMVDKPDKTQDEILFYQLRFSSGRTEGAKLDESEIRSYAEALLEKYGEKQVAVSRQGKIVATYLNAKARDVAPATQRYINTIVDESKANAEKFVRQAEQDDEVPENELKYVYKAYNDKFGYKFHDSASALDEAIKACDASYEYEGTYRGAKIQITVPDSDGTRNVYLDGRALWQDEGSVNKVLSAVKQLIDRQKK